MADEGEGCFQAKIDPFHTSSATFDPIRIKDTLVQPQKAKANCHLNIRSYVTAIAEAEKAFGFWNEFSEPFTIQGIAHEGLKNFDRASTSYTVRHYK